MNVIDIRPFRECDRALLVEAAQKDGHGVFFPSWVLWKKNEQGIDEIVGYYSVAVPIVLSWQDAKKTNAADAVKEIGHIEGTLGQFPFVAIPCDPASPFMQFLPKHGYQKYFKQLELFLKVR